jgi:lysophospholipase L1-like esterase
VSEALLSVISGMSMRRWHVAVLALLALVALACDGTAQGSPSPTHSTKPKSGLPTSMAALGDSISVAYASCAEVVLCTRNSWSTGTAASVDSHYLRIRAANRAIRGHEHTYAVPGAQAADLAAQARRAVAEKVGYVTVLIGANDACAPTVDAMTSASTFRSQVDAALAVLKKGLPKAHVLVVSIPDLYRLWQVGHTDADAVRAWNLGICPSLLADPTSTSAAADARRRQVEDRVDAYDRALAAACDAYGRHCRWDSGAVHSVRFSLSLVSHIDYFHPSASGQKRLAEATYPGSFTW